MKHRQLVLCFLLLLPLLAAVATAQAADEIVANSNRTPAGKLEKGVLTLKLELRNGAWRPEADDGPQLFVQAFGEAGHPAQIPGPLLRMPVGTNVHVTVTNKLDKKATVYGLNTRPGDPQSGVELAPNETKDWTFAAGTTGTYYYWARTSEPLKTRSGLVIPQPLFVDTHLNGAFIVDPVGTVPADRVFVINAMAVEADVLQQGFEVVTINGKSYPYTEPLEYTAGETIRWRVINPSFAEHPMHLHGAFYKVLSLGDYESDTLYPRDDQQSVVTENLLAGHTMMMEWTPEHVGRWLFHCHFQFHISGDERIPIVSHAVASVYDPPAAKPAALHHDAMGAMGDMAGLVLTINVKAAPGAAPTAASNRVPRKVDLVVEPTAAAGSMPTFSCSVREGKKLVASQEKAMGPPIVLTRGEPVEITVLNHLSSPTTIHWHGLELESYYDGVIGGGTGDQVTPAIAPGASFTAHFTPSRAGTFIYHTHAPDPSQLSGGVYGPLIVLEPGESFDPEHDKILMVGSRDTFFDAARLTLNGAEQPSPISLSRGAKYRLRVINMAPNLAADFRIGTTDHPASWRAIAKDGATVPTSMAKMRNSTLHIASGEAYDFEFQPDTVGEIPFQVENAFGKGKLMGKIVVQ